MYKNLFSIIEVILLISVSSTVSILYTQNRFNEQYDKIDAKYNSTYGVFAIIRPDENGKWYILDDKNHSPIGIVSVAQFTDRIEVYYEHDYQDIYWSAVTPDDSLNLMDIDVGASVDRDKTKIFLAKSGKLINPSEVNMPVANIWIYINGKS